MIATPAHDPVEPNARADSGFSTSMRALGHRDRPPQGTEARCHQALADSLASWTSSQLRGNDRRQPDAANDNVLSPIHAESSQAATITLRSQDGPRKAAEQEQSGSNQPKPGKEQQHEGDCDLRHCRDVVDVFRQHK
jgi:hypothetical protein